MESSVFSALFFSRCPPVISNILQRVNSLILSHLLFFFQISAVGKRNGIALDMESTPKGVGSYKQYHSTRF